MKKTKNSRQLERHLKGIANHRRIDILILVGEQNGITLDKIAEMLNCNIKTIAGHTAKLVQSGLLNKRYVNKSVAHSLSPYGQVSLKFILTFSRM